MKKHKSITFETLINMNLLMSIIASMITTFVILFGLYSFDNQFPAIVAIIIATSISVIPIYSAMIIMNKIIISRYHDILLEESNEFVRYMFDN